MWFHFKHIIPQLIVGFLLFIFIVSEVRKKIPPYTPPVIVIQPFTSMLPPLQDSFSCWYHCFLGSYPTDSITSPEPLLVSICFVISSWIINPFFWFEFSSFTLDCIILEYDHWQMVVVVVVVTVVVYWVICSHLYYLHFRTATCWWNHSMLISFYFRLITLELINFNGFPVMCVVIFAFVALLRGLFPM